MPGPTPCPRCGSESRLLVVPRDRHDGLAPATDASRRCVRVCASAVCAVGFTQPQPDDVAAAPAAAPGGEVQDRLAGWIVSAGLAPLVARVPRAGLVVDVGAGSGLRARALADRGLRVIALEPDPIEEMRAHAMVADLPAGAVEVVRAGVDDLPGVMDGRVADAAVMWHVLEHLQDMDSGLARVRAALRTSGALAVAVPNRASAEARAFGPRWHGWEPSRHRWHLDEDALRLVLGSAGFAVDEVGTRGGWGYPSALAYSIAPGLDPQVHPRRSLAGRALAAALIPAAAAARLSGRGGQLVAVATAAPA